METLGAIPALIADVRLAVVQVDVVGDEGRGNGSGFAIAPLEPDAGSCVIVTNAHVVAGARSVSVRFYDDRECAASTRVVDASTDVAILRVERDALRVLSLRPLRGVHIGEPVIALGSPYGLSGTVTLGIVSGLDRTMPAPNGIPIDNMVQTDALINPGNSGGPLIGFDGAVVGVNDQTIIVPGTGATGLGFAVPADTVRSVYEEICATGLPYVRRASLGVSTGLRAFTGEERAQWSQHAGALIVAEPRAGGPAAAAGLLRGDVIVSFDGEPVDEPGALYRLLDRDAIGRECPVLVARDGVRVELSVVPGERPRPVDP